MDERRGADRDALAGPDGTAPSSGPAGDDPTVARPPSSDLRLPPPGDQGAVARWMDDDRERGLQPWSPEARDVPPPRPIPPTRRHRPLPPETPPPTGDVVPRDARRGDPDEPAWRREMREEAEFRAQFGEWRTGAPPVGGPRLGGVRLGAPLLVLLAILVAVAAIALHL